MTGRSLADIDISEFHIGSADYRGVPDFNGSIDEFRIWSGALAANDIAAHFALGPDQLEAAPVIESVAMNPPYDSLTMQVSGLVPGRIHHLTDSTTLRDFTPPAGSRFVAAEAAQAINASVYSPAVSARFFRLVKGSIPGGGSPP